MDSSFSWAWEGDTAYCFVASMIAWSGQGTVWVVPVTVSSLFALFSRPSSHCTFKPKGAVNPLQITTFDTRCFVHSFTPQSFIVIVQLYIKSKHYTAFDNNIFFTPLHWSLSNVPATFNSIIMSNVYRLSSLLEMNNMYIVQVLQLLLLFLFQNLLDSTLWTTIWRATNATARWCNL